jgi:hypothetical protein
MAITDSYYEYPNAGWWNSKAEIAKKMTDKMTDSALWFSRKDCHKAAKANPATEGKYMDELSIYVTEINRRLTK